MKIIISPYSNKLKKQKINAKNWNGWNKLVSLLVENNHQVYQLSVPGEPQIPNTILLPHMRVSDIHKIFPEYDTFISVDNFFHHMAAYYKFPGYVIFTKSDPNLFGNKIHTNISNGRQYYRKDQYNIWDSCPFDEASCISAEKVFDMIK